MNPFYMLEAWALAHIPGATWDMLEATLGLSLIVLTIAQRTLTPRFRSDLPTCHVDRVTVRLSQLGLVVIHMLGCLMLIDGLVVHDEVPRVYAILTAIGYILIHGRVVLLSLLELWPLKNTMLAVRYGAHAYYAWEYRAHAEKKAARSSE